MNFLKVSNFVALILSVVVGSTVLAGEGHDHDHDHGSTSMMAAQKGGVVKAYDQGFLEMVVKGKNVKVYFSKRFFTYGIKRHQGFC